MTDKYVFWIHGAAALIDWEGISYNDILAGQEKPLEDPEKHFHVRRDARGCLLQLKKAKWIGTRPVEFEDKTEDVYAEITVPVSLAIPTATFLDDDETDHYYAFLNCTTEEPDHPRILSAQIFKGKTLIKDYPWPVNSLIKPPVKKSKEIVLDLPNERCDAPLLIYVKIRFDDTQWIWFEGAGARIEERT